MVRLYQIVGSKRKRERREQTESRVGRKKEKRKETVNEQVAALESEGGFRTARLLGVGSAHGTRPARDRPQLPTPRRTLAGKLSDVSRQERSSLYRRSLRSRSSAFSLSLSLRLFLSTFFSSSLYIMCTYIQVDEQKDSLTRSLRS